MVITALTAAVFMLLNDIAAVLLVQSEARNRPGLSAIFDSVMWLASIFTTTISVTALQGHHLSAKALVIVCVTLANVAGCYIGVAIGRRFIKERNEGSTACEHCKHTASGA